MPGIKVREGETFEQALRRFKRQCERAGVLAELKKREYYEKPSERKKRKSVQARKRGLRKLRGYEGYRGYRGDR